MSTTYSRRSADDSGRTAHPMREGVLAGCAVVMAHPDDEILWASSVLGRAGRVVLCFGPVAGAPHLGPARGRVLAAFPLGPVEFLALPEAGVLDRADWSDPRPTAAGLALGSQLLPEHPGAIADYAVNHARLCAELTTRLAGVSEVVTHNPWGEYGHEEHVQVLRAVEAAQAVHGFRVWVTAYIAPKSLPLMLAERHRIGPATPPLPTDRPLAERLKALYAAEGCWTWGEDYLWPETERFFRLQPADSPAGPSTALPLNVLPRAANRPPPLAALGRRLRRKLRLRSRLRGLRGS